jgi:nicotinamidase-related amidase
VAGVPVIHIQHDEGPGSPYDVRAEIGAIVDRVAARRTGSGGNPNSFVLTDLDQLLKQRAVKNLVLAGFMTHMCVNSTARGAFNLGYAPTVVAAATATRPLPALGAEVSAAVMQLASLAALADLFAVVVPDAATLPD